MLSLIFTALLGLFCYSGSIDNRLNCYSNFSKVIMQSNNTMVSTDSSISNFSGECTESYVFNDFRESNLSIKSMINTTDNYTIENIDRFCSPSFYIPMLTYLQSLDNEYWSLNNYEGRSYTFSPSKGAYSYTPSWAFFISSAYTGNILVDNDAIFLFPESITITRSHGSFTGTYIKGDLWDYSITFSLATSGEYSASIGGSVVRDISCNFEIFTNIKDSRNNSVLDFRGLDYIHSYLFASNSIVAHAVGGQPLSTYNWSHLSLSMDNALASADSLGLFLSSDTYEFGYEKGYDSGVSSGYYTGYEDGYDVGLQNGYSNGYQDGVDIDSTASTIFTGILDVALVPVNVFLTIFNFEVFGINIAGIVSALLTISVVVIIIRFVTGKKDD